MRFLPIILCLCLSLFVLEVPHAEAGSSEKNQHYIYLSGEKKKNYHVGQHIEGVAAWYGERVHGNFTTSGQRFHHGKLTAAHRTLPFGTVVRVTNKKTKKHVTVVINDRGPLSKRFEIDISRRAAEIIGMRRMGIAPVSIKIVSLPSWYTKKAVPHKKKK